MMVVEMVMMMMDVAMVVITMMLVAVMVKMVTDECLSVERYVQSKIQSFHVVNSHLLAMHHFHGSNTENSNE
jgi:hypothetical protein